jgi:predicted alpha/beta-hydrolase family hydrolase
MFHAVAESRQVTVGDERVTALVYTPPAAGPTLILAHGAGADQRHPFLVAWAEGLARRGVEVVTFNFRYTEAGRKAPDRAPELEACWRAVLEAVRGWGRTRIAVGGKSMGGRIASQVVAQGADAAALVFLGYPLHPPGKPAQLRVAHWPKIRHPMLFVQGTRDPFGSPDELAAHFAGLQPPPEVLVVDGGDHSFAVPKKLGGPADQEKLRDRVAAFVVAHT